MVFMRHAVIFLATGGYAGRIPIAPGTFGSLVGIPIVYVFSRLRIEITAAATVLMVLAAVWVAQAAERVLEVKDPDCIVIDEIAGMCVALFGVPFNWGTCVAGFLLFRFFDILKPPPIRQIERRLKGGWGVVMDDVAAGLLTLVVMQIATTLMIR